MILQSDTLGAKWMRVTLDGADVTNDTRYADDSAGVVILLKKDAHGHRYAEHGGPAVETRIGVVKIALAETLDATLRARIVEHFPWLKAEGQPQ